MIIEEQDKLERQTEQLGLERERLHKVQNQNYILLSASS